MVGKCRETTDTGYGFVADLSKAFDWLHYVLYY